MDEEMQNEEMVTFAVPRSVAESFMVVAEAFMPLIKEAMTAEVPMEEPQQPSVDEITQRMMNAENMRQQM